MEAPNCRSSKRSNLFYLSYRSHLLIVLIFSTLFVAAKSDAVKAEEKVKLELYYETLCPYCSRFIVKYLYQLFDTGLIDITDLKLLPYGNARIRNGTIVCQHGPTECLLNTIEACAIDVWPDVNEHFPYIYCVENFIYNGETSKWESCFETLGLDPKPVLDCYSNGRGVELELRYAADTNALDPPHRYVPWVTVNGQPLYDDYPYFVSYICAAYKGTAVPPVCFAQSTTNVISSPKMKILNPVCYTEMTVKPKLSAIKSAIASWMEQVKMAALA